MVKAVQYSSLDKSTIPTSNFEMSKTFAHEDCVVELTVQQQQLASLSKTAAQDPNEMKEFNVFRDYFGLCQVVTSFLKMVPCEESAEDENRCSVQREVCERGDSLGSAGSDLSSSNSVESMEVANTLYYSTYTQGFVSQAFTEPVTSLMVEERQNGLQPLPLSLLLERNFGTQLPAVQTIKKPQVCQLYKLVLKCGRVRKCQPL